MVLERVACPNTTVDRGKTMLRTRCWLGLMIIASGAATALAGPGDDAGAMVARMAKIGSCSSPSFSPDGRRIAFVSGLSGLPQVWVVAAEGGWELNTRLCR